MGLLSITEKPGPCSIMRSITTAGVSLDTSSSTAGLSIGYRNVTLTQAPIDGTVAFKMRHDGQLVSYEREDTVLPSGHITCNY